ncbi:NADH dehydrogenase (ubiquinone) complex I, assembly factor 6 [Neocloeon triangulifer]|uniref:NADH dehydrogenase (ubiquinone) complex I, assembly factor 6 n=1 Tax=Neocloeon triangulifer TaxID=2078957 RepID=UPI00286F100F|nr:NADH dehydrogenase (ubiquinone) complex I, assembly factor 6 [Neocloeon triangulifer]
MFQQRFSRLGNLRNEISHAIRHKSDSSRQSSTQYCLDLVRKHDYEGFLSALLIPDVTQRTTVIALRAFNVELALVAQRVSNAAISQGRLTFWQECLDRTNPHQHPVALELHRARSKHKLNKAFLQRLVTSRVKQLEKPGHETLADLEQYAEDTVSPLLYLSLQSASAHKLDNDYMNVVNAAGRLGKAIGLAYALRGLVHARHPSELTIPRDTFRRHKVSAEKFIRQQGSQKEVQDAVYEVARRAFRHLDKARTAKVPKELVPFFLTSVPIDLYLKRLERTNFDPFHPSLNKRLVTLHFRMWYNKVTGKF